MKKKKVFILHGWTKTADKWKKFADYIKGDKFDVEILKIPGLTASIDRPWTLDDYVEWLKKIIDKEKNKAILIGHSNGGRISLAFCAKYQKKISHIVLIDAAGIYSRTKTINAKKLIFKIVAKIGKRFTSSQKIKNVLYRLAGERDYQNSDKLMQKTMVNLISEDLRSILPKISIPTIIIWGRKDKVTPFHDAKVINKLIRQSKLYVIKDARHSPQYTHPEIVADRILGEIS